MPRPAAPSTAEPANTLLHAHPRADPFPETALKGTCAGFHRGRRFFSDEFKRGGKRSEQQCSGRIYFDTVRFWKNGRSDRLG